MLTKVINLLHRYRISKYFSGIFRFIQYNLAGWSSDKSDIDFRSSSIVWSLNLTGLKSNFGVGVAGADPLYLSKIYSEYKVGSTNFKKLAKFCYQKKIYLIHISTDCVFSGKKGNYSETSKKDAKDLYGKTKAMGEVKNKYCSTIRTSFIGPETKTKKFDGSLQK